MSISEILESIFAKIDVKNKWQQDFLFELLEIIFCIQGRINYSNLARFSRYNEITFRRNSKKFFDWLNFNWQLIQLAGVDFKQPVVAAIDCSFISKAGKKTYGLDSFFSSAIGRNKQGLEVSLLSLINVKTAQAWALDIMQTPPGLSAEQGDSTEFARIDFYMAQVLKVLNRIKGIAYFVADGYYAKTKVFSTLSSKNKHLITKLRPDANLRYFFNGKHPKNRKGRKQMYAAKVNWKKLDLRKWVRASGKLDLKHMKVYSKTLNSPYFKMNFKVVLVINTQTNKYILLASTDVNQDAQTILQYYKLRFKIEFLFRDAKQFTGLTHCQARGQASLKFHFNMSLAAVNLAQLQICQDSTNNSMNNLVRRAYNQKLIDWLFFKLNSNAEFALNISRDNPIFETVRNFGCL